MTPWRADYIRALTITIGLFSILFTAEPVKGQSTMGVTGLLNSPTALFSQDGTVKIGGNFLNKHLTPDYWDYNTFNYFLNITFLPFVEIAINNTALDFGPYSRRYNNIDRSICTRIRVLKEGRYYPAVAIGSNDLLTSNRGVILSFAQGNKFFGTHYLALSKTFNFAENEVALHLAYNVVSSRSRVLNSPLSGGVSFSPRFYRELKFVAEYDTKNFNLGANIKVFNFLFLQFLLQEFKYSSFGGYFLIPLN